MIRCTARIFNPARQQSRAAPPSRQHPLPQSRNASGLSATEDSGSDVKSIKTERGADVSELRHRPRPPPTGPPALRPTTFEIFLGLAALAGLTRLLMMVTSLPFGVTCNRLSPIELRSLDKS